MSLGFVHWGREASRLMDALLQDRPPGGAARVDLAALESVPPPVANYLRHVLNDGQPMIQVARMEQVGTLNTDMRSNRWSAFEAQQTVTPLSPGFVWNAKVAILPPVYVRVLDGYVGGRGYGRVSLLSLSVAADSGGPELSSGALHRYLAEAVWYPTALVPSAALKWTPISTSKALATLTDSGVTVALEFEFNDRGEVTGIFTPARWGRFGGEYRQTPWEGHFHDYVKMSGILVPSGGEASWYSGGVCQCVWKGRVTKASYESLH